MPAGGGSLSAPGASSLSSSSLAAPSASTIRRVEEGDILYQYETNHGKAYWKRNKRVSVDLFYDGPFGLERQIEDQRLLLEKNRNPQLLVPTKAEPVRSQKIASLKGASRPVAVKANVLNKIVREASGIHTYAIVPPVRRKEEETDG